MEQGQIWLFQSTRRQSEGWSEDVMLCSAQTMPILSSVTNWRATTLQESEALDLARIDCGQPSCYLPLAVQPTICSALSTSGCICIHCRGSLQAKPRALVKLAMSRDSMAATILGSMSAAAPELAAAAAAGCICNLAVWVRGRYRVRSLLDFAQHLNGMPAGVVTLRGALDYCGTLKHRCMSFVSVVPRSDWNSTAIRLGKRRPSRPYIVPRA